MLGSLLALAIGAAAAPARLPVVHAKFINIALREPEGCDCGAWKLAGSGVEKLRDHKPETAWCTTAGESLVLELDGSSSHPAWNGAANILNGASASPKVWKRHGRVKSLKVYLNDQPIGIVQLLDAEGKQRFSIRDLLPTRDATRAAKVRFEILETYSSGARTQDSCLSGFELSGCCP